eukprot:2528047-Heterocapsa_arctica.AAC.1
MEFTREMAAARSLPDGWGGPTLRQVLEVIAGAVGCLTNGQVEMFMGSLGLWMANQGGARPPHFDDTLWLLKPCEQEEVLRPGRAMKQAEARGIAARQEAKTGRVLSAPPPGKPGDNQEGTQLTQGGRSPPQVDRDNM